MISISQKTGILAENRTWELQYKKYGL